MTPTISKGKREDNNVSAPISNKQDQLREIYGINADEKLKI